MKKFENKKIAFLGPRGTFTEEALLSAVAVKEENLVPYATVYDVIKAIDKSEVKNGIVPIENSIEGSVNATLDVLTFEANNLLIEREIIVPIRHRLIVKPGVGLKDITTVVSHPQAVAQCRKYLAKNLPGIEILAANSTADAVRKVAEANHQSAAIGTELAAKLYGLKVLKEDIEDFKDNKTRFVLLGKEPAKRTGKDKTSIVVFIYEDRPGSLLQILQEFAYRYINLTKIQSRPTKKGLGNYCFWIDMEGHVEDEVVSSAIKCLKCKFRVVKVLGSYPAAKK
ncbi:prephenate dehydratase [Candidatus Oleimmundimicrobium sp.]|uniref:prephenate dehydratase n=1 Tax=Candidatus Oleimmundimicrobium sp. TaxID=3060597 RepID=UPI00271F401D|nr:prephenate dehydratase [Candidatus Oleimmundimicrobium sp.]MDO8886823.1 prephenate dehydratase [Candidatus Oleimmundimicrobium sp.]